MNVELPKYEHNCSQCKFLGRYENADLYFCEQFGPAPTVIARYSNEGSDYLSGMRWSRPFVNAVTSKQEPGIPEMVEARERAERAGYLGPKQ